MDKCREADAIVIGSPVYYDYPTAQTRAFLEHNEGNTKWLLGYCETLYSCDTYQYQDYSRMDCNMFEQKYFG